MMADSVCHVLGGCLEYAERASILLLPLRGEMS